MKESVQWWSGCSVFNAENWTRTRDKVVTCSVTCMGKRGSVMTSISFRDTQRRKEVIRGLGMRGLMGS